MNEEPLVSVIMPAFNAEKYLHDSISSVLNQGYDNWELIITNDGSTDNTKKILGSVTDPRIQIIHQNNKGVSAARNAGLALMKGKYFTFLDADDLLPENSLLVRVNFGQQNPHVDFIGGGVEFFNELGVKKKWQASFKGDPAQAFVRIDERAFCNPSLFIRRKANVNYQFKEGMSHVEDLLFFAFVASQQQQNYDYIKDVVYSYRLSGSSAMSNLKGLEDGYWMFYDSVKKFPNALPKNIQYLKWRIIRIMFLSYLAAGKIMPAVKVLPKTIRK